MDALNWLRIALEFLHGAVAALDGDPEDREVRLAMVELTAGIELLLKGRLALEYWPLVFEDPHVADPEKFSSGDFKSLNWDQTFSRLERACKVIFTEADRRALDQLRNARNKLMHQGQVDDKRSFMAKAVKALTVMMNFIETERLGSEPEIEEHVTELRTRILQLERYVDQAFARAATRIAAAKRDGQTVVNCPDCHKEALVIDSGELNCVCCNYKSDDPTDALDENCDNLPTNEVDGRHLGGEVVEGCCNDQILRIEGVDKKGVGCGQEEICFVCGLRAYSLQREDTSDTDYDET